MRLNDRVCSGWFAVEQNLCQGCVLGSLLFNIFFVAVIKVAHTRFKAHKDTMDALVHLRKKTGAGGSNCRRASPGDAALGHALRRRCRSRVVIPQAAEENDGGDYGRMRGVWPHHIGGRD